MRGSFTGPVRLKKPGPTGPDSLIFRHVAHTSLLPAFLIALLWTPALTAQSVEVSCGNRTLGSRSSIDARLRRLERDITSVEEERARAEATAAAGGPALDSAA